MNHRKKAPDLNLPVLLVLLMAGIIVATGGISYVVVVNKQVTIRREIERSESRLCSGAYSRRSDRASLSPRTRCA